MSAAPPLTIEQKVWRSKILVATFMAYVGFYLVRKVFNLTKTTLTTPIADGGYGMDYHQVANIGTIFLVAYMLGQFINSFIGRKYGPRVLLLGGLGVSIACNVVFGFANSYATFMAFMFFNGIVQAAGWPGAVGGVAEWLRKDDRGTVMGVWSTSYLVGNFAVKWLGGFLLAYFAARMGLAYGVRFAFFGCTVLAFAVWWLVYFWQRNRPEDVGLAPIVDPATEEDETVDASEAISVSFKDYLKLLLNPVILMMGSTYFCVKFLRYALDSWLPTFLDIQGMSTDIAAYSSSIYDVTGLAGAVAAGVALDRVFRGRWDWVCAILALGLVAGYIAVTRFGTTPGALAVLLGIVGFMLYGIDTLLCGAAAVVVAGERNAVAVAGIINGVGSIGPVVQEQVIGLLMEGENPEAAIGNANLLGLSMSVLCLTFMIIITVVCTIQHKRHGHAGVHP